MFDRRQLLTIKCLGAVSDCIQYLDELQLVVKVPLEPENKAFEAGKPLEHRVACNEFLCELTEAHGSSGRQETRADATQLGKREITGNGPVMENVAPGQYLTGNSRFPHEVGGTVAVGYMKRGVQRYWPGCLYVALS